MTVSEKTLCQNSEKLHMYLKSVNVKQLTESAGHVNHILDNQLIQQAIAGSLSQVTYRSLV